MILFHISYTDSYSHSHKLIYICVFSAKNMNDSFLWKQWTHSFKNAVQGPLIWFQVLSWGVTHTSKCCFILPFHLSLNFFSYTPQLSRYSAFVPPRTGHWPPLCQWTSFRINCQTILPSHEPHCSLLPLRLVLTLLSHALDNKTRLSSTG